MRGSREISLVPSLHRASTDALIIMVLILHLKKKHFSLATSCEYESSMLIAVLGGVLAVVIITAIIVQVLVIAFFMRKLQAKGIYIMLHNESSWYTLNIYTSFYTVSSKTGLELSRFTGKNYL